MSHGHVERDRRWLILACHPSAETPSEVTRPFEPVLAGRVEKNPREASYLLHNDRERSPPAGSNSLVPTSLIINHVNSQSRFLHRAEGSSTHGVLALLSAPSRFSRELSARVPQGPDRRLACVRCEWCTSAGGRAETCCRVRGHATSRISPPRAAVTARDLIASRGQSTYLRLSNRRLLERREVICCLSEDAEARVGDGKL